MLYNEEYVLFNIKELIVKYGYAITLVIHITYHISTYTTTSVLIVAISTSPCISMSILINLLYQHFQPFIKIWTNLSIEVVEIGILLVLVL